ncbi:HAD family phosphatase [Sulfurovum sp. zt1-1]|uniref:phosphoglycolate phosphatase n=1 Tax=Sulfurovum zhangzhouensis TaxID=3019067 RepID=A0ABT7QVJ8_9BACT|nr:HAD family phosphatase [Sulfurovum zhangzhouensis]MDM5270564.1 HAD family phosphatase [Sulfurovum zhangzhouensis]
MKKYLLFDNDGVLVETEQWYFRANYEILKALNITLEEERYKEIMINGQSALLLAEEQGYTKERVENERAKRNELYQHYLRTEDIAIPSVHDVLSILKEKYRMGIITSARREDFELIHEGRGIVDHMEFVLCSGEYVRSKPHPDPYLKGLSLFDGEKQEALVIEDSERGLRSAVNAGIECAIVDNHFTTDHDFSSATYRIQNLEELITLLEGYAH